MKRKPIIGETLYERYTRRKEPALIPVVVTKVGRKYFTCQGSGDGWNPEIQYHILTWSEVHTYGSADRYIYESPQDYQDEQDTERLRRKFADWALYRNLPLAKLRRIDAILQEPDEN